jgi:hypothetical protein
VPRASFGWEQLRGEMTTAQAIAEIRPAQPLRLSTRALSSDLYSSCLFKKFNGREMLLSYLRKCTHRAVTAVIRPFRPLCTGRPNRALSGTPAPCPISAVDHAFHL